MRYKRAYQAYLSSKFPLPEDAIKHFVYFSRNREEMIGHQFLYRPRFSGAQIMYSWKELEVDKGVYDFSVIHQDFTYLKKHEKRLFIQLQDATFNPQRHAVPDYVRTDEYDGGDIVQLDHQGKPEGWVAKRWNKKVQQRFASLLLFLGEAFDGKIEGINLQESAISVSSKQDTSFSPKRYVRGDSI